MFARELEVGTEVAVRNNVVVVMCDLCVRYTNIVDHYIPNISACLRDDEAVIREQTLIMLTNLLQVGTTGLQPFTCLDKPTAESAGFHTELAHLKIELEWCFFSVDI